MHSKFSRIFSEDLLLVVAYSSGPRNWGQRSFDIMTLSPEYAGASGFPEDASGQVPLYNLPPIGLTVMTPAVSPQLFQPSTYRRPERLQAIGAGARGVEWLYRIKMSLESGVLDEQEWAISALMELSFGRPDVLRDAAHVNVLNMITRYAAELWNKGIRTLREFEDTDAAEIRSRQKLSDALLVIRNISLDLETSRSLVQQTNVKSLVKQGLHLPLGSDAGHLVEIRLLCLELAENTTLYFPPDPQIFNCLIQILDHQANDRGALVAAERCLSRLSVHDDRSYILSLKPHHITLLLRQLLTQDIELISASLDLLYQFTMRTTTIEQLFPNNNEALGTIDVLIKLLTFKMDREQGDFIRLPRRTKRPQPAEPPQLTQPILQELLSMVEPERATNWIRASYEPDPEGEVTQVSLWNAYQAAFEPHQRAGVGKRLLRAIDFIRNVTTAFRMAEAMVVTSPSGEKRFIIRGFKPREKAVSPSIYAKDPALLPDNRRRTPPAFGATAALVLQNIASLQGGQTLMRPLVSKLIDSACVNSTLWQYIDGLLAKIGP